MVESASTKPIEVQNQEEIKQPITHVENDSLKEMMVIKLLHARGI